MQPPAPAHTHRSLRGLLVLVATAAQAFTSLAQASDGVDAPGQALYAAPTRPDRVGRMLAAVEVNGSGPYRFIIDLGANRSVLSSRLAEQLGLDAVGTETVQVHGVTGSAIVPMALVDELRVGNLILQDQRCRYWEEASSPTPTASSASMACSNPGSRSTSATTGCASARPTGGERRKAT